MYLRYVYKLHDLHIASDNFIEAGCTLLVSYCQYNIVKSKAM